MKVIACEEISRYGILLMWVTDPNIASLYKAFTLHKNPTIFRLCSSQMNQTLFLNILKLMFYEKVDAFVLPFFAINL